MKANSNPKMAHSISAEAAGISSNLYFRAEEFPRAIINLYIAIEAPITAQSN